jgi:hypothetical protein
MHQMLEVYTLMIQKAGNLFGPPTRHFWREDIETTTGAETPGAALDTD